MERENQRIMLTKRLLKESILRLLDSKELDKISVTELCRDAGINRATFYRHYEIPRDVLIEIERDFFYELKDNVELPRSQMQIRESIENLCGFMEKRIDLLRKIIRSSTESDFAAFINGMYAEIWQEIRKAGILSQLNDEDVQLLTLYCAGGSYFVLRQWLVGKIHKSSKEMADYVYTLLNKTDWTVLVEQLGLLPR